MSGNDEELMDGDLERVAGGYAARRPGVGHPGPPVARTNEPLGEGGEREVERLPTPPPPPPPGPNPDIGDVIPIDP